MNIGKVTRVAVNGYGVIGKRVADAVAKQNDMQLAGVVDVVADWRPRVAVSRGMPLFGAAPEHAEAMRKSGLKVAGILEDLLGQIDVVVDCTPKRIGSADAVRDAVSLAGF
jgi:glyceraldehyde-3-phosphate dehydrogenase (NAD(P))